MAFLEVVVLPSDMAATAKLLEPTERLFEEAPRPSATPIPANLSGGASPRAIAEKIVQDAERQSRGWVAKFADHVDGLRKADLSQPFWEAMGAYISAHLTELQGKIDENRAQSEVVLNKFRRWPPWLRFALSCAA